MENSQNSLLTLENLDKHFDISGGLLDQLAFEGLRLTRKRTIVRAVNGVSLDILPGETLSVVGESGCGKSTLARTIMGLYAPENGAVYYRGARIDRLTARQMLPFRRKMQMIFQDPYASLNPRKTVKAILREPVRFHNRTLTNGQVLERVEAVMEQVGVDPKWADRHPHEFSGGQRQRISIARALMVDPEFIVADEPVSALDVSIQAQILNLMMQAQAERGLTYLFITHDLSVVQHISTRVAVMYLGHLCEVAPAADLFASPFHPYTQALLSAIPKLGARTSNHVKLKGEVPTPIDLPDGCIFHPRCIYAKAVCRKMVPKFREIEPGRRAACFFAGKVGISWLPAQGGLKNL